VVQGLILPPAYRQAGIKGEESLLENWMPRSSAAGYMELNISENVFDHDLLCDYL
jgi:hypothetical protein